MDFEKYDLVADAIIALQKIQEYLSGPDLEEIQIQILKLEKLLRES